MVLVCSLLQCNQAQLAMTHIVNNKLLRKFDHVLTTGKPVEIRFYENEGGNETTLVFATYFHSPSESDYKEVLDHVVGLVDCFTLTHLVSVTM